MTIAIDDPVSLCHYIKIGMRKVPLTTNEIYHIFNRGVNKDKIFFSEKDYKRFYLAAIHYKTKSTKFSYETNDPVSSASGDVSSASGKFKDKEAKVQIFAYSLMPNHFHFLVKQLVDGGITSYLRHLANSYSHYVNIKYKRVGPLFQGRFRNVLIESQEQLIHVSRYIHLNPLVSGLVSNLKDYQWSSYLAYIGEANDELGDTRPILEDFRSKRDYERFVLDQVDYGRALEQIKHLTFDE